MTITRSLIAATAAGLALMASAPALAQTAGAPELRYDVAEGRNLNAFVREGEVAAHMLLRSGTEPRILVAFPAGNSGVGLWFKPLGRPATWSMDTGPEAVSLADDEGRALHGVRARVSIRAEALEIDRTVLSNVRFLRDYEAISRVPAGLEATQTATADGVVFARDRIDGAAGYRLELTVLSGEIEDDVLRAGPDGLIRLEVTAATGDAALTGLSQADLLNETAANDTEARNALAFLSYEEKFLAGSWRFNTYFGRDTLMSLRLLMPALTPRAIEAGLQSIVVRLNAEGEVAHEEGLSEFALVDRRDRGEATGDRAILDYAMIDDDFMLAPVAAAYLLDPARADAARDFLARTPRGEFDPTRSDPIGRDLIRNLRFVIEQARPFAEAPTHACLIGLKPDRMAGQWRDSNEGIGRGRYAYDVNAVFVPAALDAAARLLSSGLLDPYLSTDDRAALAQAEALAEIWRETAPGLFRVSTPAGTARTEIMAYGASLGVPVDTALASLNGGDLDFNAIALDAEGRPVPIVHSDEGFALLFTSPDPLALDVAVQSAMRPFPAGLMTDAGLLVANPVLATPEVEARFSPREYHGAVVWSWQQALFAAGLERQLARDDLPAATRARLTEAQTRLWEVIRTGEAVRNSELWSWIYADGRYQIAPFGAENGDVDESNAAQLWSTVYLAVRPPAVSPSPETP